MEVTVWNRGGEIISMASYSRSVCAVPVHSSKFMMVSCLLSNLWSCSAHWGSYLCIGFAVCSIWKMQEFSDCEGASSHHTYGNCLKLPLMEQLRLKVVSLCVTVYQKRTAEFEQIKKTFSPSSLQLQGVCCPGFLTNTLTIYPGAGQISSLQTTLG